MFPPLQQGAPDAAQTRLVFAIGILIGVTLYKLLRIAPVSRGKRFIERSEDECRRIRGRMGSDQVQLFFDEVAEIVQIEIVQVVIERILDFLSDLEETKEEEWRESSTRNGNPAECTIDLELSITRVCQGELYETIDTHWQEEKVEPEWHAQVGLICKR